MSNSSPSDLAGQLRRDVAAYISTPPTPDEIAIASYRPASPDLDDDTDWEALYADEPPTS